MHPKIVRGKRLIAEMEENRRQMLLPLWIVLGTEWLMALLQSPLIVVTAIFLIGIGMALCIFAFGLWIISYRRAIARLERQDTGR